MNLQTLDKEKMDSMKALSDVHIKISDAKNLLFKLQEEETEYLVSRENKALTKIEKVVEDSKDLLKQAHKNYEEVQDFCRTITEYANFLQETHGKFDEMVKSFNERNDLWDKDMQRQQDELTTVKRAIKASNEEIEAGRNAIKKETKQIEQEKRKLQDRRESLERAIIRLKEGRK